ncbi:MAG: GGDEF domain-containing protein, partial [Clostridia bacterium]|nr:GGDEF domain-containing protein [Clostridia bacterium]
ARVALSMQRDALLQQLMSGDPFSITYRQKADGAPVYYNLRAVDANARDGHHIVVGISNVDEQMRQAMGAGMAHALSREFLSIAHALSSDFESIYHINVETGSYTEFVAESAYGTLEIELSGEHFFEECRRNLQKVVFPEDQDRVRCALRRETLLKELEGGRPYSLVYRLVVDGEPVYYRMKAVRFGAGSAYIVIGVANVDAQMKREQELSEAREKANRDALTGVKSKHAYVEAEAAIDEGIARGTAVPFAVAVCDVNGLKQVNDAHGHKAGDQLIRDASAIICNVFSHSPVFRTGGDEFVAILRGKDYGRRAELMEEMAASNRESALQGGPIVASGLADFLPGRDGRLAQVFDRADQAMYANKERLKASV